MQRLHAREPHIRLEPIFGQPPPDAVARAVSAGVSRVSCHFTNLTQAFVDECHGHGIEVIGWPPNTRQEQVLTAGYGVDLIGSDRPDILVATLLELGLRPV